MGKYERDEPIAAHIADAAVTAGVGTGADGTTPSGAEYTLSVDDITALVAKVNAILVVLENAGLNKTA